MLELRVDDEFRSLIPPLSRDERAGAKSNAGRLLRESYELPALRKSAYDEVAGVWNSRRLPSRLHRSSPESLSGGRVRTNPGLCARAGGRCVVRRFGTPEHPNPHRYAQRTWLSRRDFGSRENSSIWNERAGIIGKSVHRIERGVRNARSNDRSV